MGKMINPQYVCDEDDCEVDISECSYCQCSICIKEFSIVQQFHSCEAHKAVVDAKHLSIRGTVAWWKKPT